MPDGNFEEEREWIVVQRTGGLTLSGMAQARAQGQAWGQAPGHATHTRPYTAYSYRHEEQFELRRAHLHTTTNDSGERRAGARIRRGAESYACGREVGDDSQASRMAQSKCERVDSTEKRSGAEIRVDVPEFRSEADELPPLTAAYPSSQVCDLHK